MNKIETGFGSQIVYIMRDPISGFTAFIVLDSPVNGHCCGGLKISPDVSISELEGLARVMTLKFGFLGMKEGGAKAGIVASPDVSKEEKMALLLKFAEMATPLLRTRTYVPASDIGTTNEEIRYMLQSIGVKVRGGRISRKEEGGYYVAFSVLAGALAGAQYLNLNLPNSTVAIEGFGKVGGSVARVFSRRGAKVVAISTARGAIYNPDGLDVGRLMELRDRMGDGLVNAYNGADKIDKEELLTLDVDILCPCAGQFSINMGNAEKIKARIISPGANMPITREAEEVLWRKGKLVLPDFVTNCGGILGTNMELAGIGEDSIGNFIVKEIKKKISEIIEVSWKEGVTPTRIATREAERKFRLASRKAERKSLRDRVLDTGLALYKTNLVPRFLVRCYALRFFARRLR